MLRTHLKLLDHVLGRLVQSFNEDDGRWLREHPNKPLIR